MIIHSFNELTEEQRRNIYRLISNSDYKGSFASFEEMQHFFDGVVFDYGRSFFSIWDRDTLKGTLGVISKEAAAKGEIFITVIIISEQNIGVFEPLLKKALEYCSGFKGVKFRLGVMHDSYYLIPAVERFGFIEANRNLVMKYQGSTVNLNDKIHKCFKTLSPESIKDYQKVESAAFLNSPNGGAVEDDELPDLLEEFQGSDLAGVLYENGVPAGTYTLRIKEDAGWIESIGVAPEFQGKGIGRILLYKSLEVLQRKDVPAIKLSVFSSNTVAVQLYLKCGFTLESEQSIWFEKE